MAKKENNINLAQNAQEYGLGHLRLTVQAWLDAWEAAKHPLQPRRQLLMRVYETAMNDNHLEGVTQNRFMKVQGEPFLVIDKNDVINEELAKLLDGKWFNDFVTYVLESIMYGFSTIELHPNTREENKMKKVELVPRACVLPEKREVLARSLDMSGTYIGESSPYEAWYIHVNAEGRNKLGLINKAVVCTIFKRLSMIGHTTFNEGFGLPMVVAKSPRDDDGKEELLADLEELGRERVAVIGDDEDVQILWAASLSDASGNFDGLVERANTEISKLISGHVKGADDNKGAQTYVNKNETEKTPTEERKEADMALVENIVNEELIPRLVMFGFPLDGCKFMYQHTYENLQKRKKAAIDAAILALILNNYDVPEEWIEDNFGVPAKKKTAVSSAPAPAKPVAQAPKNEGSGASLRDWYAEAYAVDIQASAIDTLLPTITKEMKAWRRRIYDGEGEILPDNLIEILFDALWKAVGDHMALGDFGEDYVNGARQNIYLFCAAKTYRLYEELKNLLMDGDGNRRTFGEFAPLADALNSTHNNAYLNAEYFQTVAAAQIMQTWHDATKDGSNPLLRFRAVSDERTSTTCRGLNGIVRPANDGFYSDYMPPRHFYCRSTVEVVTDNEPATDLRGRKLPKPKEGFSRNVGKEGTVFAEQHPYIADLPADVRKTIDEKSSSYGK